ncbi:sulfate anion transporter [Penicillium sp. IBT 18751x]|nr:sulfate anion transporter [Penicillium sp. IBT 18751x]
MGSAAVKKVLGLNDITNVPNKNTPPHESDPTVLGWFHDVVPTRHQFKLYLARLFPFVQWMKHYNLQWLMGDLVAGLTVGAVVVPQSMAYAKLANLPVQYGLYTSFMGVLIYWFFATSKDITIGPVAVMSAVVGSIVLDVQVVYPNIAGDQIALSIAVVCGGIITLMGLARMGFVVDFIPLPAIEAFMTGSAITICSGQMKQLLGQNASFSTSSPAYRIIIDTLKALPSSQVYDATMGVTALVTLYIFRAACNYGVRRKPRFSKHFFFLGALRTVIVIILFTIVSFAVNMRRRETPAFALIGMIPRGFKHAGAPVLTSNVIKLFAPKLPACIIVLLIEHIAVSKSFGRANNYKIDPSQELIAIGITNLLGPFVGAYPATGSFSRSAIQSNSGSRSPLAGVITACVVLIAMYTLTAGLYYTPQASLSGVIIHAVGDLIVPPNTIYQFWLISPLDVVVFTVGLVVALVSTIPNSIYATVCLSASILLFRHAKAPGQFLGQTKINDNNNQRWLFLPLEDANSNTGIQLERPRPGVFVYRFAEGFNYPNANHYFDALVQTILKHTRPSNAQTYVKKGDRPWNDPGSSTTDDSHLPLLRAIILDFSAVNNVDVTSIHNLVDVRNQLNVRAAPAVVHWHFANIKNRWTKRALAAVGFGSVDLCDQPAVSRKPNSKVLTPWPQKEHSDVEIGFDAEMSSSSKMCDKRVEAEGKSSDGAYSRPGALESRSQPFFHVDLTSALQSVDVYFAANPEWRSSLEITDTELK